MQRNNSIVFIFIALLSFLGSTSTIKAFDPGPAFQMKKISENIVQIKNLADDALKNVQEALKKLNEAQQKLQDAQSSLNYEMKREQKP